MAARAPARGRQGRAARRPRRPVPDVRDRGRDVDVEDAARPGPPNGEMTERELGVGQPVAEREQWCELVGVIPAISDVEALGVEHLAADARELRRRRGRYLRQAGGERHRQVPARVHLAEQDVGQRRAVRLPRVPGVDYRCHVAQPRHRDRRAGIDHDHRVPIGRRHRGDQFVLCRRQIEAEPVCRLRLRVVGDDDHRARGRLRRRDRCGQPGARLRACPSSGCSTRRRRRVTACRSSRLRFTATEYVLDRRRTRVGEQLLPVESIGPWACSTDTGW